MTKMTWTKEAIQKEAAKYATRGEFSNANRAAYNAAWKRGMLDELGLPKSKWTEESIMAEAKRFPTKREFRLRNPRAYEAAQIRGLLQFI